MSCKQTQNSTHSEGVGRRLSSKLTPLAVMYLYGIYDDGFIEYICRWSYKRFLCSNDYMIDSWVFTSPGPVAWQQVLRHSCVMHRKIFISVSHDHGIIAGINCDFWRRLKMGQINKHCECCFPPRWKYVAIFYVVLISSKVGSTVCGTNHWYSRIRWRIRWFSWSLSAWPVFAIYFSFGSWMLPL